MVFIFFNAWKINTGDEARKVFVDESLHRVAEGFGGLMLHQLLYPHHLRIKVLYMSFEIRILRTLHIRVTLLLAALSHIN